jgi:hypothetical protein
MDNFAQIAVLFTPIIPHTCDFYPRLLHRYSYSTGPAAKDVTLLVLCLFYLVYG